MIKKNINQKRKWIKKEEHKPLELSAYFGVPLETLVDREGTTVPMFVEKAIEYLEKNALDEEGILRLSGAVGEINSLREEIESGKPLDKVFDPSIRRDPNAVAGLLKCFFRELPEPIINEELNEGASAVLSYGEGPEVLEEIRSIIYTLPTPNFELFRLLVWFLLELAAHSDKNKMPANNLLRVMTPTLNCIPGLISLPMAHYDYFFAEEEVDIDQQQPLSDPSESKVEEEQHVSDSSESKVEEKQQPLSDPSGSKVEEKQPVLDPSTKVEQPQQPTADPSASKAEEKQPVLDPSTKVEQQTVSDPFAKNEVVH